MYEHLKPEYEIIAEGWRIIKAHSFARAMYDADSLVADLIKLSQMGNDKKLYALSEGLATAVYHYFEGVTECHENHKSRVTEAK